MTETATQTAEAERALALAVAWAKEDLACRATRRGALRNWAGSADGLDALDALLTEDSETGRRLRSALEAGHVAYLLRVGTPAEAPL